jgi:glycine/D-amino acid oxidase-like deaminating enzyme
VIPGIKYDPDEIERKFPERGAELVAFTGATADTVFDLIEKHGMDVPRTRSGWIQGAHTPEAAATVRGRSEQWARRGAPAEFLDKEETERHLGTPQYEASWIDRRGGAVQPLAYARGLARAALAAGAAIHGGSKVTKLTRNGTRWSVETERGARVSADRVVVCTNGYTGDLVPKLRQTVIAPNSFQIATAPLSDNVPQVHPAGRPGLVGHAPAAPVLPARPHGPLHHGRARAFPRAERRERLGPPRARGRQDVPAAERHAHRVPLVRARGAHPRFPAPPARA